MHESQPDNQSRYPGTQALDQEQVEASAQEARADAESQAADADSPPRQAKEKKPRVPLSERLKPFVSALEKIPNPAKILPKKSHRVAAASGLSAITLGVAATWSQFFGGDPKADKPANGEKPPAATAPDDSETPGKASPTLSINPSAKNDEPPALKQPKADSVIATATGGQDLIVEAGAPPAPTPLAATTPELVEQPIVTPPMDGMGADQEPTIPPLPTAAMAPTPLENGSVTPEPLPPDDQSGGGPPIIVPPPALLTQETPGDLAPEPFAPTDPNQEPAPVIPTPLAEADISEPPLPLNAQAGMNPLPTDPDPDPAETVPLAGMNSDSPLAALPPDEPALPAAESGIPNLAATPAPNPEPARIDQTAANPSVPAPPSYPEFNTGDMEALPNIGLKSLSLDQPVGEPRAIETAVAPVALASAAPLIGGSQTQLAISDAFEPVLHVVQPGENFWSISRLYYGSGRFYKALWKANSEQFRSPEDLHVGAKIKIPPPEALDRALIEPANASEPRSATAGPQTAPTRNQAATAASRPLDDNLTTLPSDATLRPTRGTLDTNPPPIQDSGRVHVVQGDNETLRTVARDELGDSRRDDEILNLNLDILEGRSRLVRGMRLRLPADPPRR